MNKLALLVALCGLVAVSAYCPGACSGHGTCHSWDKCECYANWQGSDCSARTCAFGFAWVDTPTGDNTAHAYAECSNKGLCDRKSGLCKCFDGYEGKACRRSTCPNDCSGHGTCEYIEELSRDGNKISDANSGAQWTYDEWDQSKIQGCQCDVGYDGPDCSARLCPRGDDPLTHLSALTDAVITNEIQTVAIGEDAVPNVVTGDFALTYHDLYGGSWTTRPITAGVYDDTAAADTDVAAALTGLPNKVIEEVTVTAAAGAANGVTYTIEFSGVHNSGDQNTLTCETAACSKGCMPLLEGLTGVCTVATTAAGNDEHAVCSNRGECDSSSGLCECHEGYTDEDCSLQEVFV